MRHIKMFNELNSFISNQDIKDICLELKDLGYSVDIEDDKDGWSVLSCYKSKEVFLDDDLDYFNEFDYLNWNEIKDCFLRLKDYLNYRFEVFRYCSGTDMDHITGIYQYANLNEDTDLDDIKEVVIEYRNEGIV